MSGRILTSERLAGLTLLEGAPGPWCVSDRRGTVRVGSSGEHVAARPADGWLSENDPFLLAAAPDLLATSLDLQARLASHEEDARRRVDALAAAERALDEARAEIASLLTWQREILEALSGGDVTAENAVDALSHALRDGAACYTRATRAEREREVLRSEVAMLRQALAGRGCA